MQTTKPRKSSSEISRKTSPANPGSKVSAEVPRRTSPATPRSNGSSEVFHKTSPTTTKSTCVTKPGCAELTTSKSTSSRTPVDRSPKNIERRSPRSPVMERKRPSRMTDLESQLNQLQGDLKKAKEQLNTSESWRRRTQQEAEEAKKQLLSVNQKLEDSQRQVIEFSAAEEARLLELRKITEERDHAWQSELEATQKQHSVDSTALMTAMNEIHRLKQQLEMVAKSEDVQQDESTTVHSELHALKQKLAEAICTVEESKEELRNSQNAKTEAQALVHDTQQRLEMARASAESLHLHDLKGIESISFKASELEETRARVAMLEETVKKLQAALYSIHHDDIPTSISDLVGSISLESEVKQLNSALEAMEVKYQEEQIQSTIQIRAAYELAERVKIDSTTREAELKSALKNAKAEIFESKASLIDKEIQLQHILDTNNELNAQVDTTELNQMKIELEANLVKLIAEVAELKANLLDKETELQSITEEHELLKADIAKRETDNHRSYNAAITDMNLARKAEQDALMKLSRVNEEVDKSSRRAARVSEQMEAAQAVNSEMEAELRRMRVQSDQWRKAAEAAAAALSPGKNGGRFVERTSSLDIKYQSVGSKLMNSPFSDDLDDDWPKKKNNNVMKKISGLWKKSPK